MEAFRFQKACEVQRKTKLIWKAESEGLGYYWDLHGDPSKEGFIIVRSFRSENRCLIRWLALCPWMSVSRQKRDWGPEVFISVPRYCD